MRERAKAVLEEYGKPSRSLFSFACVNGVHAPVYDSLPQARATTGEGKPSVPMRRTTRDR